MSPGTSAAVGVLHQLGGRGADRSQHRPGEVAGRCQRQLVVDAHGAVDTGVRRGVWGIRRAQHDGLDERLRPGLRRLAAANAAASTPTRPASAVALASACSAATFVLSIPSRTTGRAVTSGAPSPPSTSPRFGATRVSTRRSAAARSGASPRGSTGPASGRRSSTSGARVEYRQTASVPGTVHRWVSTAVACSSSLPGRTRVTRTSGRSPPRPAVASVSCCCATFRVTPVTGTCAELPGARGRTASVRATGSGSGASSEQLVSPADRSVTVQGRRSWCGGASGQLCRPRQGGPSRVASGPQGPRGIVLSSARPHRTGPRQPKGGEHSVRTEPGRAARDRDRAPASGKGSAPRAWPWPLTAAGAGAVLLPRASQPADRPGQPPERGGVPAARHAGATSRPGAALGCRDHEGWGSRGAASG